MRRCLYDHLRSVVICLPISARIGVTEKLTKFRPSHIKHRKEQRLRGPTAVAATIVSSSSSLWIGDPKESQSYGNRRARAQQVRASNSPVIGGSIMYHCTVSTSVYFHAVAVGRCVFHETSVTTRMAHMINVRDVSYSMHQSSCANFICTHPYVDV